MILANAVVYLFKYSITYYHGDDCLGS